MHVNMIYHIKIFFCISYSLFKPTDYPWANVGGKGSTSAKRGMDTHCNIASNKEMRKGDLWQNTTQRVQYSDCNLLSVNDIFSASANGRGIEKVQSLPCVSETSTVEGKLSSLQCFPPTNGIYNTGFMRYQ